MTNSQMIPKTQESSSMENAVMMTTTVMTTTPSINATMPEDMVFNPGHQLSIIVYRFAIKQKPDRIDVNLTLAFISVYTVF